MHRAELLEEIAGRYGVAAEYPWRRYPQYAVFRHAGNRKWFAVLMNPPGRKLGLATEDEVAILNVKIRAGENSLLRGMDAVLPADLPALVATLTHHIADLSSALKRRFNTVILPLPATLDEETDIVRSRVESYQNTMKLPAEKPALEEIRRIVTIFRELRAGLTADKKTKLKSPSGTLSTAEAISVVNNGMALSGYFGDGALKADDLIAGLLGAVVKDPVQDKIVWQEYLDTVVKQRDGWQDLYRAARDMA